MSNNTVFTKVEKAKLRLEKLKRFYSHLAVYFTINIIISVFKFSNHVDTWDAFISKLFSLDILFTWSVWGVLLLIHAFSVFVFPKLLGYEWEEKKIEQLMEEELNSKK
ncbi:2TM domain-containing protein [Winogradskyella litorisediminis]|uniref:2TM domain-containing protein n=1 Tax=Winogradskyella litorisediminis TaxID=1156618 RepID=A0ABW3NC15_9FLAO